MLIIEYLFLIFNYLLFIILLLRYLFVYLHIFILKIIAINVKLKILRKVLEEAINNIDAGNSNHSDDELDDIISSLTKLNRGIKRISKREACERILHCSPSTFDNYIKLGLIPRGHKEYGFKELNWSEKDFDKATRPYQDALIQCDIRRVAEHADFNLWRRTCRMISGEVVLPNTPVIEGYASYNPCHIQSTTPAPAA